MDRWRTLLAPDVRAFIESHDGADLSALALKKAPDPEWDYKLILDQIKARGKAKVKVPRWLGVPGLVFPSADLMEQASSWTCALYKASLAGGGTVADLTAGAGVDAAAFGGQGQRALCVERDSHNASLLEHNLRRLKEAGLLSADFEVHNADCADFVTAMPSCAWVYVDPQRRSGPQKGRFLFSDCSPDVTALLPFLKGRARRVMVKSSPVLDIARGIEEVGGVESVHVVQWNGECKEVLYIHNPQGGVEDPPIHAVEINNEGHVSCAFSFTMEEEREAKAETGAVESYLYEPGPAFMKAGGFNLMAARFGLRKLHPNTHLYTSQVFIKDFPGKVFTVEDVRRPGGGASDIGGAELVLRNYPGSVADLRARLKLAEGSDKRIFACTVHDDRKMLVVCSKAF